MKKIILSFCFISLLCILMGCKKEEKQEYLFKAKITTIENSTVLIEPIEGLQESTIRISQDYLPEGWKEDSILEISYNGDILETYPAQLGKIYNIVLGER